MARWNVFLFLDEEKSELFKVLDFHRQRDIAYVLNTKVCDVTNFIHGIKKPVGILKYIIITKTCE